MQEAGGYLSYRWGLLLLSVAVFANPIPAGSIKRWGMKRGAMTHGSKSHREHGSTGPGTSPGRTFPGLKMAGHMGNVRRKSKALEVSGWHGHGVGDWLHGGWVGGRRLAVCHKAQGHVFKARLILACCWQMSLQAKRGLAAYPCSCGGGQLWLQASRLAALAYVSMVALA